MDKKKPEAVAPGSLGGFSSSTNDLRRSNSSAITHYYEAITIPDFSDDNTSQETTVETWFEPPRITPQQSLPSPTNAPSITGSGASSGSVPLPKKKKIRQPGSHNKKAQDDPTLAPWAIRPEFIPDDGKERNKFGYTKEEVVTRKKATRKRRRDNRTDGQREEDNSKLKQWREDNKEYVVENDRKRHAEKVAAYTPEKVEELRVEARDKHQKKSIKQYKENPVPGIREPPTGKEIQARCNVFKPDDIESALPIHIIVVARKSWRAMQNEHLELARTNVIILDKFIRDFAPQNRIASRASVVWHAKNASAALPWTFRDRELDLVDIEIPRAQEEAWNRESDRRFTSFFAGVPDDSQVTILVRGMDGATCHLDSWIGLQSRYPRLTITVAFTLGEVYVRYRGLDNMDGFYGTAPHDGRIYTFFALEELIAHVSGVRPNPRYAWIISEWELATQWRQMLSAAYATMDRAVINRASAAYTAQQFRPRNGMPMIRNL